MHYQWQIRSAFEVPLMVHAPDWRTALCLGLQLLERDDTVERLKLQTTQTGIVVAHDPITGDRTWVELVESWSAEAESQAA